MCDICIEHQDILPAKGLWIPCYHKKDFISGPYLKQNTKGVIVKPVRPKPSVLNCPGCRKKIIDVISVQVAPPPRNYLMYTPRTKW